MPGAVMKRVAELLRNGDPMTVTELTDALGCKNASVWYACKTHPLIYIDHWTVVTRGVPQWVAVYSIAPQPEDTPKPTMKPREYLNAKSTKTTTKAQLNMGPSDHQDHSSLDRTGTFDAC